MISPIGVASFIVNICFFVANLPTDPEMDAETRSTILIKESLILLSKAFLEDLISMIFYNQ